MTSKLLRISPASIEAAVEVRNELDSERFETEVNMVVSIEPCGRYAWVTTESESDMAAIESSLDDGIDCGALPVPEFW
jgi:hypothetical protein